MSAPGTKAAACAPKILDLFAILFSNKWIEDWQRQRQEREALDLLKNPGQNREPAPKFYQRIFSLGVTLWYLIYQRLDSNVTLAEVVINARAGGVDRLGCRGKARLSTRIRSTSTSAYNQARQRMPLELLQAALAHLGATLGKKLGLAGPGAGAKPATKPPAARRQRQLLDGSILSVLATPELAATFPPASNQKGKSDWCLVRILVGFCVRTGVVLSAVASAIQRSEQVLAWELMENAAAFVIWIADRNFGVWSIVDQAVRHRQDVVVRLTKSRAKKLLRGGPPLLSGQERDVQWQPSRHDKAAPGSERAACNGRLIYVRLQKEGAFIDLWLFTTLEAQEYPLSLLVKWYGQRWQAELNFRSVKTEMKMSELDVFTPDMAQKEFYAGLLAYSLVRAVMWAAGDRLEEEIKVLSFNQARCVLRARLEIWMRGRPPRLQSADEWAGHLLEQIAMHTLPKRKKTRPSEIRRVRHRRQKFPPFKGSRAMARSKDLAAKSS